MKKFTLTFCFTTIMAMMALAAPLDTLYWEDFTNTANDNKGCWGTGASAPPHVDTSGVTDWFIDTHGATSFISSTKDYFKQVTSDKFSAQDVLKGNPYVSWLSRITDISAVDKAKIKVNFEFNGTGFTSSYFLKAFYVIDGGSDTVEFKSVTGDQVVSKPESFVGEISQLSGSTLQVIIRVATAGTRYINIYDVFIGKDESAAIDVTSVTLDQQTLDLETEKTFQLLATVAPEDATNPLVSWTSLNEAVATVDNGLVSALSVGTAKIVVTSNADANMKDTCMLTVIQNDTVYYEDFSNAANNDKGVKGDGNAGFTLVYNQPADASWAVNATGAEMAATTDYFVQHGGSQTLLARNINGSPDAMWVSKNIDISMFARVKVGVDMVFACAFDETEYAKAYYVVDGGTDTVLFGNIVGEGAEGSFGLQPNDTTVLANWVEGSSLNVIIRCNNNASTDYTKFDNITVSEDTSEPIVTKQVEIDNSSSEIMAIGNQIRIITNESCLLNVYNLSGALVKSQRIVEGESYVELHTGLYIASLISNGNLISKKVAIR